MTELYGWMSVPVIFDIYMYDISTGKESAVSTGPGDQSFPSVSKDIVAWADNRTGESDIAFMDLSSGKETTINKSGIQTDPRVYGRYIAYLNNHTDINLYDIETSADIALAPGSIKMEPAISERGVVWTDYRKGTNDPDIQMFDFEILADISITSGPFNHTNPSISEGNVVWTDNRDGNFNVYLFNITTGKETQITEGSFDHSSPDISNKNLIWTDMSLGNLQIFLRNLSTKETKQVTIDPVRPPLLV